MPTEPYRYRCPNGHATYEVRRNSKAQGGKPPEGKIYCRCCDDPHFDRLLDVKTGKLVKP